MRIKFDNKDLYLDFSEKDFLTALFYKRMEATEYKKKFEVFTNNRPIEYIPCIPNQLFKDLGIDIGKETEWNEPLTFQYKGVVNQRTWVKEVDAFDKRNAVGSRNDNTEKNAENVRDTQKDNESGNRNLSEGNIVVWEGNPDKKNTEDEAVNDDLSQTPKSQEGTKTKDTAKPKSEDSGKDTSEVTQDVQDFDLQNVVDANNDKT